jgi:hypothetical protein
MRFSLPSGTLLALAETCLGLAAACTTLRPVGRDDLRGPSGPATVRVTQADHSTVVLRDPKVVGDTLFGAVNGVPRRLLLSETTVIGQRTAAPERTGALVAVGVMGALMVFALDHTASSQPTNPCADVRYNGPCPDGSRLR